MDQIRWMSVVWCAVMLCACGGEETHGGEPEGGFDLSEGAKDMASVREDMSDSNVDMQGDLPAPDLALDASSDLEEVDQDEVMDMAQQGDDGVGDDLPERPWDQTMKGPYEVGYATTSFRYAAAPDGVSRSIDVSIWHPTRQQSGSRARYVFGLIGSDAFKEANIPDVPERFPVLVFSHGNGSFPEQSYFLTELFASHGWIVLAPAHAKNTFNDQDAANALDRTLDRPQDITAMLDWFEREPAEHPLGARMRFDQVAMTGHSFGGYTTLANVGASFDVAELEASCDAGETPQAYCALLTAQNKALYEEGFEDERIKAAIPVTPGLGPLYRTGTRTITTPTLFVTALRDATLSERAHGDPLWAAMSEGMGHLRLQFPNAGHYTPSNLCELTTFIPGASSDGCDSSFTPAQEVQQILGHYALAFAHYHVLGEQAFEAIATGRELPYDEDVVRIEQK